MGMGFDNGLCLDMGLIGIGLEMLIVMLWLLMCFTFFLGAGVLALESAFALDFALLLFFCGLGFAHLPVLGSLLVPLGHRGFFFLPKEFFRDLGFEFEFPRLPVLYTKFTF